MKKQGAANFKVFGNRMKNLFWVFDIQLYMYM